MKAGIPNAKVLIFNESVKRNGNRYLQKIKMNPVKLTVVKSNPFVTRKKLCTYSKDFTLLMQWNPFIMTAYNDQPLNLTYLHGKVGFP